MPEKEEVKYLDEAQIKTIVSMVAPQGIQERIDQLRKEHQDNYRDHPVIDAKGNIDKNDLVAVLDVSSASIAEIDGIPGTLNIVTGELAPGETEPRYPAQFTKQGLRVTDRYKVVINFLPTTERTYSFSLTPFKEWEEYIKTKGSSFGLNNEQMIASLMLRAGAGEDVG